MKIIAIDNKDIADRALNTINESGTLPVFDIEETKEENVGEKALEVFNENYYKTHFASIDGESCYVAGFPGTSEKVQRVNITNGSITRSPIGDTCIDYGYREKCENFIISNMKVIGGMSGSPLYLNKFAPYVPIGILIGKTQTESNFIPSYRIRDIIAEIELNRQ